MGHEDIETMKEDEHISRKEKNRDDTQAKPLRCPSCASFRARQERCNIFGPFLVKPLEAFTKYQTRRRKKIK
jgi:hypothetical protein